MRAPRLLLLACAASLALTGCGDETSQRVRTELGQAWGAMRTWGVERKDELVRSAGPMVDDLGRGLEAARQKAASAGAGASQRLDEGWQSVQRSFADMKASTGEAWARHRDAFLAAVDAYQRQVAGASTTSGPEK
jgi:hypothetical protein